MELPGKGQQKLATNDSLTLESRAPSGWCQGLGLWPVWATWPHLAWAEAAPPPASHLLYPMATGHGELRLPGPEQPRCLTGEGMPFPRNDSKPLPTRFCPGTLALPASYIPCSLGGPSSLPIWAHSGPRTSGPLPPWLHLPALAWVPGLVSSVKHLRGRLGTASGPQQLAQRGALTKEPNVMRLFLGSDCSQQEEAPRCGVCNPPFSGDTPLRPPSRPQVSGDADEVGAEVTASLLLDSQVAVVEHGTLVPRREWRSALTPPSPGHRPAGRSETSPHASELP